MMTQTDFLCEECGEKIPLQRVIEVLSHNLDPSFCSVRHRNNMKSRRSYQKSTPGGLQDSTPQPTDTQRYNIVRYFSNDPKEIVFANISLRSAQIWCDRIDSKGDGWFDGYELVTNTKGKA